jgi:hypothetical protein
MKNPKIFIPITFFAIFIVSCSKETTPAYEDKPVVESYLYTGDTLYVKVSRQVPFSAEDAVYSIDDINKLDITAKYNNTSYLLTAQGNGLYKAITPLLTVNQGDQYELEFSFNGKPVTASTLIPAKPMNYTQSVTEITIESFSGTPSGGTMPTFPDPVRLKWTTDDNSYYIVVIENIESNPQAINDFGGKEPPGNIFRSKPTQSNSYSIESMQFKYYGRHRLILFHINPDYASLYDDSGSSSQNLTSPSTTITNGLGIFTGVNSDTLMLKVKK